MLEALLLTAMTAMPGTHADAKHRAPPSLELLEFLGEFGDDEQGLFDGKDASGKPAAPRAPAKVTPPAATPAAPVTPPAPKERT